MADNEQVAGWQQRVAVHIHVVAGGQQVVMGYRSRAESRMSSHPVYEVLDHFAARPQADHAVEFFRSVETVATVAALAPRWFYVSADSDAVKTK